MCTLKKLCNVLHFLFHEYRYVQEFPSIAVDLASITQVWLMDNFSEECLHFLQSMSFVVLE